MDKLVSDGAKTQTQGKVKDILRSYMIDDWHSEPYHQHQNPFKRHYAQIKSYTNNILNRTGAPAALWLLCLQYVCLLLNNLSCSSLGGISPLQALTGNVPDISASVQFRFYEPVYFKDKGKHYPSSSDERAGYWVGIVDNCGDALTYLILTMDTLKVVP